MKYEATARYENDQYYLDTSSFETLMKFLCAHEEAYCEVVEESTGEVLCYFNAPNPDKSPYMNEEFELMTLGWMYKGWLAEQAQEEATQEFMNYICELCRR